MEFFLVGPKIVLSVSGLGVEIEGLGPLRMIFTQDRVKTFTHTLHCIISKEVDTGPFKTKGVFHLGVSSFPFMVITL